MTTHPLSCIIWARIRAERDSKQTKSTLSEETEKRTMTYVITEPCIGVKDASCVDVCPVDCIHPRKDEPGFDEAIQLFINPDECIDCGACEPECPVNAIYPEDDVPAEYEEYTAKNREAFE
jgi:NAD-dependent dihydropyrimidine dehydrogenase PreA subunit